MSCHVSQTLGQALSSSMSLKANKRIANEIVLMIIAILHASKLVSTAGSPNENNTGNQHSQLKPYPFHGLGHNVYPQQDSANDPASCHPQPDVQKQPHTSAAKNIGPTLRPKVCDCDSYRAEPEIPYHPKSYIFHGPTSSPALMLERQHCHDPRRSEVSQLVRRHGSSRTGSANR